jgi:carbon monoxide dehydrogenase subunit G
VQDVARVDDRTFRGAITASVGPIEGRFTFTSTIEREEFPTTLEVATIGTDSITNSPLRANVTAWLESPTPETTALAYRADVTVGGRLAILGEMVLRATASVIIGQLVSCLRTRLEAQPAGGTA